MSRRLIKGKAKNAAAVRAPKPAIRLPQNPAELEAVLAACIAPDTAAITAATRVMDAFLKLPEALPAMMQQIQQSANAQARQMAAVLLRGKIDKLWRRVKPEVKEQVVSR